MITVDIKSLLKRLNPNCARCLEASAGLCVSRTHYEVTIEHFFLRLMEDTESDLSLIFQHHEVDIEKLKRSILREIDSFKSGNSARPVFSPILMEWLQDAWLTASVDLSENRIRSGTLLLALLKRPIRFAAESLREITDMIDHSPLLASFSEIVKNSTENEAPPESDPNAPPKAQTSFEAGTALSRFCTDFTARAKAGEIDPVFGRDTEIRAMIDILARRRKNNPIIVGEAGVGKTAVAEGLALRIVDGEVPDLLKNVRIVGLDIGLLQAGSGVRGEFENRLKSVIEEVKSSERPIILFIDEAHVIIGAGGPAGGSDAANLLKPALARGELRTIAATTWSEYKKYFEKDAALARRFQPIKLEEPSVETTILILRGLKDKYETTHGVVVRDDAITAAAELAGRYISGRYQPDKAVDLLDTSAARVKVLLTSKPDVIEDKERTVQALEREKEAMDRDRRNGVEIDEERRHAIDPALETLRLELEELNERLRKERELCQELLDLRKQLHDLAGRSQSETDQIKIAEGTSEPESEPQTETNPEINNDTKITPKIEIDSETEITTDETPGIETDPETEETSLKTRLSTITHDLEILQGDSPLLRFEVDPDVVARVVSDWTDIPLGKVMRDEARNILQLKENLAKRIKGQEEALHTVTRVIEAAKSGLTDPNRPLGIFLLVGPSGVGKTETGLATADLLFGGERFLVGINMSEFQEKHTVSRLIGSPPGYVGYGEGGALTEAVRKRPYSVVLLDEVEKANLEVMNLFYQVFDKGSLSDGEGREIDFRNTILFMTSNLGGDVISELCAGDKPPSMETVAAAIRPILSQHFKPALLARMTIIPYQSLGPDVMKEIVVLKMNRLAQRLLDTHKIRLDCSPDVIAKIADRCVEVETGARNIDHIMNGTILPMMSMEILTRMSEEKMPPEIFLKTLEDGSFQVSFDQ